jgi:hypothetical protein
MKRFLIILVMLFCCSVSFAECVGNCTNGQGAATMTNGDRYVGEFKDGKFHGQGTLTYKDGRKYVGGWKNDKRHGQGTYTHADGDIFKKYCNLQIVDMLKLV